jgi:hypothetical protein
VTVLQAWIIIGIPALVTGLAMFLVRSAVRAVAGYVALVGAFIAMAFIDRASAAVLGGMLALVYAAGRGGTMEGEEAAQDTHVPDVVGYKNRRQRQAAPADGAAAAGP